MTFAETAELTTYFADFPQHVTLMEAEFGETIPLAECSIARRHQMYRERGDTRQPAYDTALAEANAQLTATILEANPDLQWTYQLYVMKMAAAKVSAEPDSRYTIIVIGGAK